MYILYVMPVGVSHGVGVIGLAYIMEHQVVSGTSESN